MTEKKRVVSLVLTLLMALALVPTAAAKGSPYYIRVNRATCTVTVYATDDAGQRGEAVKAMVCSVGKPGRGVTPRGVFTLTGYQPLWCRMKDGSYGQYVSQFRGNYLFHSVCYRQKDPSTLIPEEYNDLGSPASLGCIRLQTGDAKWIYENCPAGTKVEIFDGAAADDPLGKPEKRVSYLAADDPDSGWDPTDPRPENPWNRRLAAELEPQSPADVALPSIQTVEVNGQRVELQCCVLKDEAGNETNYIKLRDLADLLNGSSAQFEVDWDGGILITTGQSYTPNGTERIMSFSGQQTYEKTATTTLVDGQAVELDSFVLKDDEGGGHTFFKLRDLGKALGFTVDWTAPRGIFIETGET